MDTCKRRYAMKIVVSMDERGWIVAKNAQGDILEECFFKTDDETDEEIRAWGYQRLVHAYPTAQIVAGEGIDPQEIEELQKAHGTCHHQRIYTYRVPQTLAHGRQLLECDGIALQPEP